MCDWKRFNNRREVSSYTGLCPGEHSSGGKRKQGHVTKHGNPRLRAALVECAWRLVRFQPQYPPVRKRMHLLGKGARATGAARKKAIVTVARHRRRSLAHPRTDTSAAKLGLQLQHATSPKFAPQGAPTRCSVPLLDWTGDKLSELIQDQAYIHPAQKLCEGAAQVSSSVARRGRSVAVTELAKRSPPLPLVAVHLNPGLLP
ncbi:MAG: IS110 family transposase [Verrucomicrobiaceae bacterium]|nr:IS110 family transposase [Verrucomicrobiaceae bacterium]